jgi:hypothetical protein
VQVVGCLTLYLIFLHGIKMKRNSGTMLMLVGQQMITQKVIYINFHVLMVIVHKIIRISATSGG